MTEMFSQDSPPKLLPSRPDSVATLLQDLIDFEDSHNLYSIRLQGQPFWDYIRYQIYYHILEQNLRRRDEVPVRRSVRAGKYLKELVAAGINRLKGDVYRQAGKSCDIMCINYERTNLIDDKYVNMHMYPLVNQLHTKYRIVLVDLLPFEQGADKLYPCTVVQSRNWHLWDRLKACAVRFSNADNALFDKLSADIAKHFDVEIDMRIYARYFFAFHKVQFQRYRILFEKYSPRLVIVCDNGNQKGMIHAAHERGIQVVDFLHGILSKAHILYNYPKRVIDGGLSTLPDIVFTQGNYWNAHCRMPAQPLTVGYPYLEAQRRAIEAKAGSDASRERIVFISDLYAQDILKDICLRLAKLHPEVEIVYKLRREQYSHWRDIFCPDPAEYPNIKVVHDDIMSLYEYFHLSTFQVGVNSTALIEGLAFGLHTFVLIDVQADELEALIRDGYARPIQSAEDISRGIQETRKGTETEIPADIFFKRNALGNLETAVADLIGEPKP